MGTFSRTALPWLFRVVSTLALAPPLYLCVALYLGAATNGPPDHLWHTAATDLGALYLAFTVPAFILLAILAPLDWLLQRIDFGLTTLVLSPLVAGLIVFGLGDLVKEPHVQKVAAALPLFVVYGLVWGLTIRDPVFWRREQVAGCRGPSRARGV